MEGQEKGLNSQRELKKEKGSKSRSWQVIGSAQQCGGAIQNPLILDNKIPPNFPLSLKLFSQTIYENHWSVKWLEKKKFQIKGSSPGLMFWRAGQQTW